MQLVHNCFGSVIFL